MNEDRKQIWENYTGAKPPYMAHPWLNYNRYQEADLIIGTLKEKGINIADLSVLDYGAGVGDYGMALGRLGATVWFYDNKEHNDFEKYRLSLEPSVKGYVVELDDKATFAVDLAIFGEVLEHLDNPLGIIETFVKERTKYIFTSSYPYRSDDPNDDYWHHRGHKEHPEICAMQKPMRELLNEHYTFVRYDGEKRLWLRK